MKTVNYKGTVVHLENNKSLACLVLFYDELIQINCPSEVDLQNEPKLLKIIDEYIMKNRDKYEQFSLYQFSSYANATIHVKVEEVETEEEADTVYNIFKKKEPKKEDKKNILKEIANELDKLVEENSKELPEYKGRKFIFRRELVLKDKNVINSPMAKSMKENSIFIDYDGKEIEEVKELCFMGKKKVLGFINDMPFEIEWCEEIK